MRVKNPKTGVLILCAACIINFSTSVYLTKANTQLMQTVSLAIQPSLQFSVPETLNLPTTTVSDSNEVVAYKAFSPSNEFEKIKVTDLRENGGFKVTIKAGDFISGVNRIPVTKVGIITVSDALADSVDTPSSAPFNVPPGTDYSSLYETVRAPLDCTFSSTNLEVCPFSYFSSEDDRKTIIDAETTTTGGRIGQYWIALGISLKIPAGTPTGNYRSVFTIDIYPNAFP